jgi:putative transposase
MKQITRKIRIYPNEQQKILFNKCFNGHRYFYNKTIEQLNKNELITDKKERNKQNSFYSLRNTIMVNDSDLTEENLWMKDIPYDTRQLAIKCVISARKAAISNLKAGNIKKFNMNFLSKKYNTDVFYINKSALRNGHIFKQRLKKDALLKAKKDKELLKSSIGDFTIIREKDGKYYACICIKPKDIKLDTKTNICALDPGVRTFQTMFSETSIGEFGYSTSKKLYQIYRREDKIKSILSKNQLNSATKYKLKKRCAELRTKAKYIVDDLHWRTADLLTKQFQVILLPIFNTKQMANKNKRKLSRTSTRLLLGLSHYAFQQKLLYKAKQRGVNVILCKEHYTSKCCGNCGELNQKLGSKKIFTCVKCNIVADRDIHAARNILLRGLSIYSLNLSDVCDP